MLLDLSPFPYFASIPPQDLVRLGGNNDGGYVVSYQAVLKSHYLLSFGIAYDINFEYDFVNLNKNLKLAHFYDQQTKPFAPKYILSIFYLSAKYISPRPIIGYFKFLQKRRYLLKRDSKFFKTNVSNSEYRNHITFKQSLNKFPLSSSVFLKIDIEGDEFLILPEILSNLNIFSGIVIEFHGVNTSLLEIQNFIISLKNNGLLLDHFHVNNYGGVGYRGLPDVIELSFSRISRKENRVTSLPIPNLDNPNSPNRPDYNIIF